MIKDLSRKKSLSNINSDYRALLYKTNANSHTVYRGVNKR